MRLRRSVLMTGCTFGAVVLLASSAWAWCSPSIDGSSWAAADPNHAPDGTTVSVRGGNWARGTVRVHLGSAATPAVGAGEILYDRGNFSVSATIPERTAPGNYALVVVVNGHSQKTVSFVVTAPSSSGATTGTGEPSSTETSTNAPVLPRAATSPERAAPAPVPAASSSSPAGSTEAAGAITSSSPAGGTEASSSPAGGTGAAAARRAATAAPVGNGPLAVARRSPPAVITTPAQATASVLPGGDQAPSPVPSARSAAGDLWKGFADGGDPMSAPGLIEARPVGASQGTSGQAMAVVAVSGLVALLGGFALAELGRRRSVVASGR